MKTNNANNSLITTTTHTIRHTIQTYRRKANKTARDFGVLARMREFTRGGYNQRRKKKKNHINIINILIPNGKEASHINDKRLSQTQEHRNQYNIK